MSIGVAMESLFEHNLRLASGGYIGGGLYHSQNIEGALTTLPGARIVCPSFADDAAGLLRTSMRSKGLYIVSRTESFV